MIVKYGNSGQDIYYWLLQDIDTVQFRWNKQKTIDILKWFLKGFNEDFLSGVQIQNNFDFEKTKMSM